MKKGMIRCVFFLLFVLMLSPTAGAQTMGSEDTQSTPLPKEYNTFTEAIPGEVADLLPEAFFSNDPAKVEGAIQELVGIRAILNTVGEFTGLAFSQSLALLAQICGILLLGAVFRALSPQGEGAGKALSFCTTLAMTLLLLGTQSSRFSTLSHYFDTVQGFSAAMLPMMGALYAMGGNVRVAVANHGIMSAFLSILETFCAGSVLPIAGICMALALLDAVSGRVSLRPLAGFIKRTYTLTVSFLMLLLCGVLGMQTTLAKAGDTLALRTARFAAGSFLPVIGGSIAESLRTVAAGVEYLRGVAGTGAILVLFLSFLPMFLSILLTRVAFLLGGTAAKLLCCEAEEKILSEMGSIYGYFMAVIAALFVMTVFSLVLFARCAAAG